jgi:hypothetical protein
MPTPIRKLRAAWLAASARSSRAQLELLRAEIALEHAQKNAKARRAEADAASDALHAA